MVKLPKIYSYISAEKPISFFKEYGNIMPNIGAKRKLDTIAKEKSCKRPFLLFMKLITSYDIKAKILILLHEFSPSIFFSVHLLLYL
jgi:hypothetical protein